MRRFLRCCSEMAIPIAIIIVLIGYTINSSIKQHAPSCQVNIQQQTRAAYDTYTSTLLGKLDGMGYRFVSDMGGDNDVDTGLVGTCAVVNYDFRRNVLLRREDADYTATVYFGKTYEMRIMSMERVTTNHTECHPVQMGKSVVNSCRRVPDD